MTELIRDVMDITYGKYKYLGRGVVRYKKKGKSTTVSFNDTYNVLLDYGIDKPPSKVKDTLDKINNYKKEKK